MPDMLSVAESPGFIQFPFRKGAGLRRHSEDLIPQFIVSHLKEKGGIHTAGKSHSHTAQFPEAGPQIFQFITLFSLLHIVTGFLSRARAYR